MDFTLELDSLLSERLSELRNAKRKDKRTNFMQVQCFLVYPSAPIGQRADGLQNRDLIIFRLFSSL